MEDIIKNFIKDYNNNNSYKPIRDKFDVTLLVLYKSFKEHGFKTFNEDGSTELGNDRVIQPDWNSSSDSYTFTLKHDRDTKKNTFVIKSLRMGSILLVNAMIKGEDKIYTLDIDVNKLVKNDNFNNVDELLMNIKELSQVIDLNLIQPLVPELFPQNTTSNIPPRSNPPPQQQQQQQQPRRDPLMIGEPRFANPFLSHRNQGDPDLYPMGLPQFPSIHQPYGGNIYQGGSNFGPNHPIFGNVHNPYGEDFEGQFNIPRGSVPPGARFDPFGPPQGRNGTNPRGGNPDRDDFRPPSFDPPGFI